MWRGELKGEPLTRETASKADETDSLWPHARFFSSLVFATVAHSAPISLAIPSLADGRRGLLAPSPPKTHTQFVVDGQWQDGDNHNLQLPPTTAMWSLPLTVGGSTKVREREQTELEIM